MLWFFTGLVIRCLLWVVGVKVYTRWTWDDDDVIRMLVLLGLTLWVLEVSFAFLVRLVGFSLLVFLEF